MLYIDIYFTHKIKLNQISVHLFYNRNTELNDSSSSFSLKFQFSIKCKKCLVFFLLYFIAVVEKDALHYNYISHFRTIRNVGMLGMCKIWFLLFVGIRSTWFDGSCACVRCVLLSVVFSYLVRDVIDDGQLNYEKLNWAKKFLRHISIIVYIRILNDKRKPIQNTSQQHRKRALVC